MFHLPFPIEDDLFQDLCRDIAREFWKDPTAKVLGTRGNSQDGLDVISPLAKELGTTKELAIQCKKKKTNTGQKLTKRDITESLELLDLSSRRPERVIFATTSSIDIKIQDFISEINKDRNKDRLPLADHWFWEDIEKILQDSCPDTYLKYLMAILPNSATSQLYDDLLAEALTIADNYFKDNYSERAIGAFGALEGWARKSSSPKVRIVTYKLEVRSLLHSQKDDEALDMLEKLVVEFPDEITFKALLFDRYFQIEDRVKQDKVYNEIIEKFPEHQQAKNFTVLAKILANSSVDISIAPTGTPRENAQAYRLYSIYSKQQGDTVNRNLMLQNFRLATPKSPLAVYHEIINLITDFVQSDDKMTLEGLNTTLEDILAKEEELKTLDPLSDDQRLDILVEKMRLDIATIKIRPSHMLDEKLMDEILAKIIGSNFDIHMKYKLVDFLTFFPATEEKLDTIVTFLTPHSKRVGDILGNLIFSNAVQLDKTLQRAKEISKTLNLENNLKLMHALEQKDAKTIYEALTVIKDDFLSFTIAGSISEPELALELIKKLEIGKDRNQKDAYSTLKVRILIKMGKPLSEIKKDVVFAELTFLLLHQLANYAREGNFFDIESECLSTMLKFDLNNFEKADVTSRLIYSKWQMEDYPSILEHSEIMLSLLQELPDDNARFMLKLISQSAEKIGKPEVSLEILTQKYALFSDDFQLYHLKAGYEIDAGQFAVAYSTLLQGFKAQPIISNEMLRVCFNQIADIIKSKEIVLVAPQIVEEGCYVKISDISTWFYIGNDKPIDANPLKIGEDRCNAILGKKVSDALTWPTNGSEKVIELICNERDYLHNRIYTAMIKDADEGTAPVWSITAESPEKTIAEMRALMERLDGPRKEIFQIYKSNPIPFALLAKAEGGIGGAMGKLQQYQEGFLYINDGRAETMSKQLQLASEALQGKEVFIDSTSILLLEAGNLFRTVCENIPNIVYVPSVVNQVRKYASRFAESLTTEGRIAFTKDNAPIAIDYDYQRELTVRNKNMGAAELLESVARKDTSQFLLAKTSDFETGLPNYITDPFAAARASNANIISEDFFYGTSLEAATQIPQPSSISSLAIVEALYEAKRISYDQYLDYVGVCNLHRCKHILVSVPILKKVLFGDEKRGIITIQSRNLRKLHLHQTLSTQYGVPEELASDIAASFIVELIKDPAITIENFDEILPEFLVQVLQDRKSAFGDVIIDKCQLLLGNHSLIITVTDREPKSKIAFNQIRKYFSEFNPLYKDLPMLLSTLKKPQLTN